MILAVSVPEKRELVISAADNIDVLRAFLSRVQDEAPQLIQDTDYGRFLSEPELSNYKLTPTILEFPTASELEKFIADHGIDLTNFTNAHGRQRAMLAAEEFRQDDPRTLAEVHGLVENDPWDRRTDEEKAEAEALRQKMKAKRADGEITEDSWGGGGKGGGGSTTPAKTPDTSGDEIVVNDDGTVSVGSGDDSVVDNRPNKKDPNAAGGTTGGDIDPESEKEGGLRIRDIEVEIDPITGEVRIGRVVADKDMFAANMFHLTIMTETGEPSTDMADYEPIIKRAGLAENTRYLGWEYKAHEKGGIIIELGGAASLRMEGALAESGREYTLASMAEQKEDFDPSNPFRIALDQMVEVYFRVDVKDHKREEILAILDAEKAKEPYRSNDVDFGCWLAYVRERFATDVVALLATKGISAEMVEVDPEGERYIEEGTEGVKVLDQGAAKEEPPAPWNDRANEYYAMTEEEQKETRIKLLPFLLYCLRDYGYPNRIIAHITPKTYFNQHGKMWDGDFPFDDLMPDTFEKYGTKVGVYQNKALNLNTADFTLGNQRQMKESLNLMSHVNSIGVERAE